METILNHNYQFIAPSGATYTIREQNGMDDDILSNPSTANDLMNISNFISAIVVDQNFYEHSGKISPSEALRLPCNDRYAILINSRIHSVGNDLDFKYNWGNPTGEVTYSIDLSELVFNKSVDELTDEDLKSKPEAIPMYPGNQFKDIQINLPDGKELLFDIMSGESEQHMIKLPLEKRTKNQELIARNLRLNVNGNFERVTNFSMFTKKQMEYIRKVVLSLDPIYSGNVKVEHPNDSSIYSYVNIIGVPDFFWPGEIE